MAAVTQSNDGKKAMADEELPGDAADDGSAADEAQADEGTPRSSTPARGATPKPSTSGGGGSSGGSPKLSYGTSGGGGGGFFTIAKKGQGYWTRMGTAIGAGMIGALVAFEIYQRVKPYIPNPSGTHHDRNVAAAIALGFLAVYSLWAFWFTNKPSTVDFLIATDSEMKKVNWTTRRELIGSTKIVIIFMFLIAIFLFACDLLFGAFFYAIHVLKTMF